MIFSLFRKLFSRGLDNWRNAFYVASIMDNNEINLNNNTLQKKVALHTLRLSLKHV
jgi:hypothetical protein